MYVFGRFRFLKKIVFIYFENLCKIYGRCNISLKILYKFYFYKLWEKIF